MIKGNIFYRKNKIIVLFFMFTFLLIGIINASIKDSNNFFDIKNGFWLERISNYAARSKLIIRIANKEDLHNTIDDIANPFEGDKVAIKEGKKHYVLKGCASLHCHGPAAKGSGGPALNQGKFKHSDGSTYSLAYIITNGIAGTKMGVYGASLKEDEILKLIAYIRAQTK